MYIEFGKFLQGPAEDHRYCHTFFFKPLIIFFFGNNTTRKKRKRDKEGHWDDPGDEMREKYPHFSVQ